MRRFFGRIIRYYGVPATVQHGETETAVRAFIRPVTAKSWQSMRSAVSELGELPLGQYVFLGPPDCGLASADGVYSLGERFEVRRAELLLLGETAVYTWGLLEKGGAEDRGAD